MCVHKCIYVYIYMYTQVYTYSSCSKKHLCQVKRDLQEYAVLAFYKKIPLLSPKRLEIFFSHPNEAEDVFFLSSARREIEMFLRTYVTVKKKCIYAKTDQLTTHRIILWKAHF